MISAEPSLERIKHLALTDEQISDSQKMLEEHSLIERHRTIGLVEIYAFTITLRGFNEFANVGIPDFNGTVSQVMAILARQQHMDGDSIAEAVHQPLRVVEHILEMLENNDLIKISRQHGGPYMNVWDVSASLRRRVG